MKRFVFEIDTYVEGTPHKHGEVFEAKDIPAGCLESCLYVKSVRPLTVEENAAYEAQTKKPDAQPVVPAAKK